MANPSTFQAGETMHSHAPDVTPQQPGRDVSQSAESSVGHARYDVGQVRRQSDVEREVAILHEGRAIEQCMAQGDRSAADAARTRMEALIRGRSPEQVERMERERGLR